jgi:tetratricopeptide (TPR) repeat protein
LQKLKKYESAISYFQKVITIAKEESLLNQARFELAKAYAYFNQLDKAKEVLSTLPETSILYKDNLLFKSLLLIKEKKLNQAALVLNELNKLKINFDVLELREILAEVLKRPITKKSALISGILSLLLPGAGQLYCERVFDAIFTFFVECFCVVMANHYKTKSKEALSCFWWLGFWVFHAGNVYGGCLSAYKFNKNQYIKFINKIEKFYPRDWIKNLFYLSPE